MLDAITQFFGSNIMTSMMLLTLFSLTLLGVIVVIYLYASRMHPKERFLMFSKTGAWTRSIRLYNGKFPTEMDIMSLLLGKKNCGFPIELFDTEYFNGKKYYLAQYVEGRIFPLPFTNKLGYANIYVKFCPKCNISDWTMFPATRCQKCKELLAIRSEQIEATKLHELKFRPDLEKRAAFGLDVTKGYIPLQEWITMYDIGQKIAEEMDRSEYETKDILDKNNPILTVIIASLPMAIILAGFSLAIYLMFMGLGGEFSKGTENLLQAAQMLNQTCKVV